MRLALSFVVGLAGAAAAAGAACTDGTGEGGSSTGTGHAGASVTQSGHGASGTTGMGGLAATSGSSVTGPCNVGPDVDGDGDGWTPAEGDCDDCDPGANPGAIDTLGGTPPALLDRDCDGQAVMPASCDDGIALDDVDPMNAARALDLCQTAPIAPVSKKDRRWGVLGARWVSASGVEPREPAAQVGILDGFGKAVHVQSGARMLALSTGRARVVGQPSACKGPSCAVASNIDPPQYFPQVVPGCEGGTIINDDVALEIDLRTPTNAVGFAFALKFYSFEYPEWVCTPYNDQFVALVSPPPPGSIHGNVAFDALHHPVSVNLSFFDVCNPASVDAFAANCGAPVNNCPKPPNPYCAAGAGDLEGTGFDVWGEAGATRWLATRAPVSGGSDITVRFAIWDTTDQALDSTALLDGFSWITGGPAAVSIEPLPSPK